jgi:renalase
LPGPGGMHPRKGGPIAWIADNERKGIASSPCLTVHASPDFSQKHIETDLEEVKAMLIEAATTALACEIVEAQVHRWRYALPLTTAEEPCLTLAGPAPIILAGDGFGGPRIEGAFLSGMAAAAAL